MVSSREMVKQLSEINRIENEIWDAKRYKIDCPNLIAISELYSKEKELDRKFPEHEKIETETYEEVHRVESHSKDGGKSYLIISLLINLPFIWLICKLQAYALFIFPIIFLVIPAYYMFKNHYFKIEYTSEEEWIIKHNELLHEINKLKKEISDLESKIDIDVAHEERLAIRLKSEEEHRKAIEAIVKRDFNGDWDAYYRHEYAAHKALMEEVNREAAAESEARRFVEIQEKIAIENANALKADKRRKEKAAKDYAIACRVEQYGSSVDASYVGKDIAAIRKAEALAELLK